MRRPTAILPLLLLALPVQGQEVIERDFDVRGHKRLVTGEGEHLILIRTTNGTVHPHRGG